MGEKDDVDTDVEGLLHFAWTIICNARPNDASWDSGWYDAKNRFRELYHEHIGVDTDIETR